MTRRSPGPNIQERFGKSHSAMTTQILGLGLTAEMVASLSGHLRAHIHQARDMAEAGMLIERWNYASIVLDASACRDTEIVTALLGRTPLTTTIVLFCNDTDLDPTRLLPLGVKAADTEPAVIALLQDAMDVE